MPDTGDYVSVGRYPFVLYPAAPGDLDTVVGLVREASRWLKGIGTDQWQKPWPSRAGQRERIRDDLLKGKTWLLKDGQTIVATITVDNDEPLDLNEHPVWPSDERSTPVMYVRRVIVSRQYASQRLGAALLDWAADRAERQGAELIRIDVWTTNKRLHHYYENRHFKPCRNSHGQRGYPSQALFERPVGVRVLDFTKLFRTIEA